MAFLNGKEATVNRRNDFTLWDYLNWNKIRKQVSKLQTRIAKAVMNNKTRLRKRLSYLLIKSYYAHLLAIKKVSENKGGKTPGIDGEIWSTSKAKLKAVSLLKSNRYKSKPLKRIYIEKKGKKKKRPLSIPCMIDRAVQALYALILEPVSETTGDIHSYGFRKYRSTKDACSYIKICLQQKTSATWVLEADIKGCFDNIDHDWLMKHMPLKESILTEFLKAKYKEGNKLFPTTAGVPQGGIISPILANLTLDGLEDHIQSKYWRSKTGCINRQHNKHKVNLIRYADDLIITADTKETAMDLKSMLSDFLQIRGLELSEEKTKITNIREGFNFLGWNFRKYNSHLKVQPSKESINAIKNKIGMTIRKMSACTQEALIGNLNPVIRGWGNYHNGVSSWRSFRKVDKYIFYALWQWAKRRHPMKSAKWLKDRYWIQIDSRDWIFSTGKYNLKSISGIRYIPHRLIKVDMNCFLVKNREYYRNSKSCPNNSCPVIRVKIA